MNFNDMSIFVSIYEIRSINKSSKILQYAQSNLSARLKVLETELDTKLFYRKYNGLIPTESGDLFYQFCKETSNKLEKLKKKCKTSKISILISELLFNHDINNSQTIDLDKSEINIQKTSDIPIIAHQEEFDKIFCFQKIENLKHYDETIGHIESVYACSSNIKATEEMPIFVNKDKNCPFRKQSLMKFAHLKSVVEIDSFENIISLVENGKGIALLPKWLNKSAKIKPYDQDIVLIPFYQYEKQNQIK